ncbi:MAG: hypothetical protein ACUVQ1_07400 [Candidatus Kapaibacteriales bacterium]
MPTLAIESNGTIEMTAVYYNGNQLAGIRELFLNLDEDGTFDALIVYKDKFGQEYVKHPFNDYLDNIEFKEPTFTEEEAKNLHLLEIESDGNIQNTLVYYDHQPLDGLVNLFLHIKAPIVKKSLISSLLGKGKYTENVEFKATFTFRYEGGQIQSEDIFL